MFAGEFGMLLAVTGTLLAHQVFNWQWILAAILIGSAVGVPIAYIMPMTAVPQRTAMSHACGALAAALVGTAEFYREPQHGFVMVALVIFFPQQVTAFLDVAPPVDMEKAGKDVQDQIERALTPR